jgi:hypothetical protein
MFAGLHSRRKKKVGVLFFLIQGVSLQVYLGWFLFFMKTLVKVTMIGAWDFKRMRSCAYMKEGGSARGSSFRF